jgi:transposase
MNRYFLGIDIAKDTFAVALLPEQGNRGQHRTFGNTKEGFQTLLDWQSKLGVSVEDVHVCMEATSTYGQGLASLLHEHGYTVSIVNPYQIKSFAQSELRRAKNDKQDAAVIARFCRSHRPDPWKPAEPALVDLQALARRLDALQIMHTQETNRIQVPNTPEVVQDSIRTILTALEAEIASIQDQIRQHFECHPQLKAQRDLIDSIKGIGESSATILLAEIGDYTAYGSARQLAAHSGLVPTERQSGTSIHGKPQLSKQGNARIRKALYWPAIAAMRFNPLLSPLAERLRQKGKANKVIIAAIMRKLLHLVFGVLKTHKPFDPNYQPAVAGHKEA